MSTEELTTAIEDKLLAFAEALELDVELETEQPDEETLYFNFDGEDADLFLHNKTEHLRSLGSLLQNWLEIKHNDTSIKIKLDARHNLRDRETSLRDMAVEAASSLEKVGDEVTLDTMNPYDRRLVHMALSDRNDLQTMSRGEGHFKRMVIRLVEPKPEQTEA